MRVDKFTPVMTDLAESTFLDQFRWWDLTELSNCPEPVAPRALAQIVSDYLARGAPEGPIAVETLVDAADLELDA